MKTANLNNMIKGWFIGNFEPSLYKTNDVEVAVKSYCKGMREDGHFHKIATEFTVILNGKVKMFNKEFSDGDIIVVEPGDKTAFECMEDTKTVVVKIPGANDDKYICEQSNTANNEEN